MVDAFEERVLLTVVLDPTFDTNGLVTTRFGGGKEAHAVGIQANLGTSKIVIAGSAFVDTGSEFAVVRLNLDGSVDTTFGNNGLATGGFKSLVGARDLVIQPDGKIVVVGSASDDSATSFLAMRLLRDADLDPSFGTDGVVRTETSSGFDLETAAEVAIQNDGKIVAVGTASVGPQRDVVATRYPPNGTLDTGFGNSGWVTTDFAAQDEFGQDLVLQSDGKIIVAARGPFSGPARDFHLVRYNAEGSLDANGTSVACDFGRVDTGSASGKRIVVRLDASATGMLTNSAVVIDGTFGPKLINDLLNRWNIPKNFMCIGSPGDHFMYGVAELGGVRLIS